MGSVRGGATTSIADGAIVGLTKWKTRVGSEGYSVTLDRILM